MEFSTVLGRWASEGEIHPALPRHDDTAAD